MLLSYDADQMPQVRMIGRIHYLAPWAHFSRTIDEFVLYILRDGDMYLLEDGQRYHLRAGDFFLLEPGLHHEGYQAATCDYYYVHFSHPALHRAENEAEAMDGLREKRRASMVSYNLDREDPTDSITYLPKWFHLPGTEHYALLRSAIEWYDRREEHYKRMVSAMLHQLLLQTAHANLLCNMEPQNKKRRRSEIVAEQLLQYLNQNYAKKLSSREIEERFEVNFDSLNRAFSAVTGDTVFSYLNMLRMNQAKQLIQTTNLSFAEIGYLVGIDDRYYFSKLFHKQAGVTPTEYYEAVHEAKREVAR